MKRFWMLIGALVMLSGCGNQEPQEGVLRLLYLSHPNSLDPRFGYEIPANHTVKMLFEGLFRKGSDGTLLPACASHYTLSEDQKSYTFFLRDTKWTNGDPVTAFDFEYAWKGVIDPTLPTQGGSDFYPIKGVEAAIKGEGALCDIGIHAVDEGTLIVELETLYPFFLELTTSSAFMPVCKKVVERRPLWADSLSSHFVTNGPFYLKKWGKQSFTLMKNPLYWNSDAVSLKGIDIAIIEDVATQLALFEKGESDWFGKPFTKLPLDAVPSLMEKGGLCTQEEEAVYWYFLNVERFPFNNTCLRRAFSLALNRESVVSHVLKEGESAATSVNRGASFFQDGDHQLAKQLFEEGMDEIGRTLETFPEVKLSYCAIETNHRIAQVAKEQWEKLFGIRVVLDPSEWSVFYDRLSQGDFQIGGLSWHARIPDPLYNLQLFQNRNDRLNMSNWEHPPFKELVTQARLECDLQERARLLKEAEAVLMEEMPIIPIYFLSLTYTHAQELEGVYLSENNDIDFTFARFKASDSDEKASPLR